MSSPGPAKKRPSLSSLKKHSRAASVTSLKPSLDAETPARSPSESEVDETDFGNGAEISEDITSKARLRLLLESFDEEQMSRYEIYRRVGLNRNNVKKLVNSILGQSVPSNIALVVAGASKVFIGDLVESARRIQARQGEEGSLMPDHLRGAYTEFRARAVKRLVP